VASVSLDCPLFMLQGIVGGTTQTFRVLTQGSDDHLIITQNNGTGGAKGTVGATGALTLTANTWYRLWIAVTIPVAGGTGNVVIECRIEAAATDTNGPTAVDCTATYSNLSNTNWAAGFGGHHSGAILGQTLWVDNLTVWNNVTPGDEFYTATVLATINGDGTDNDFTASTGSRFSCVDETTPNGSGTTDSDYVSVDTTAGAEQTFTVSYTKPTGYDRPVFVRSGLWHRNSDGGKWTTHKHRYRFYSGTVISDIGAYSDPGSSYLGGVVASTLTSGDGALNGDPAQIAGLETGVAVAANVSEAALWKVSAIGCELTFMRPRERRQGRVM
jgi:hypothetical protein